MEKWEEDSATMEKLGKLKIRRELQAIEQILTGEYWELGRRVDRKGNTLNIFYKKLFYKKVRLKKTQN